MVWRSIIVPTAGTFLLFLAMMWASERSKRARRGREPEGPEPGLRMLARHVIVTVVLGYLSFLVLVGGYYYLVARQTHHFLEQALSGGAFLAFVVALPTFLFAGWVEWMFVRRRDRRSDA